jgi:hypothetical protein
MSNTLFPNVKYVTDRREYRNEYTTYTGFESLEQIKEYEYYLKDNLYVYFPEITRRWEEDGKFFAEVKMASSC